jgi:hypothetical protein
MMRGPKAGRNDLCPCGSGKKFKRCCETKQQRSRGSLLMVVMVAAILAGALFAGIKSFTDDSVPAGTPGRTWSVEHGHYH